ncbi:alpha/beta-hydrolase [Lentinus tigrinus ALCF2SS1-7]|uniref:Alpha/beta-hydrolase n=1 Tax=Lentinus tigrinus ALCF2SS1-6 TaxID=1328759 RepID=A0A5C2RW93_9APHY|nr:alpha/beta-hydrolase [Lentinus tigrinus ALCF2SS1-6]RPD69908.1 alpha/beta-hydrolase [Lentinus tigrinus ALCF2SS1-7]
MVRNSTHIVNVYPSPRFKDGLRFVAKRYVGDECNPDGITLLFFHCTASPKEIFGPTILNLLSKKHPTWRACMIREAWTFDHPGHGEAGVLNSSALKQQETGVTVGEWCESFKAFYASGIFDGHTLVPLGHSLGATAALLATVPSSLPAVPFKALIFIEPSMITQDAWNEHVKEQERSLTLVCSMILKRRDTWDTRADARRYFESRLPWSTWDPRAMDLFIKHGLKEIPLQEHGSNTVPETRVTLCCDKGQEYSQYKNRAPHILATEHLRTLDASIPVHFILGERESPIIPKYCHESVLAVKPVASLQTVSGAGHFVPQEKPNELATCIVRILTGEAAFQVRATL